MIKSRLLQTLFPIEIPLDICKLISHMAGLAFKTDCIQKSKENWKRRCIIEEEVAITRAIKRIRSAVQTHSQ